MQSSAMVAVVVGALFACKALNKDKPVEDKSGAAQSVVAPAASAPESPAVPAAAGGTIAASPEQPMQWAAGQWTRHRVRAAAHESIMTYKVLKKDGDDFLLEMVSQNAGGPVSAMQIVMTMKDVMSPQGSQIKSAKIKLPGGRVQEFKGALLAPVQETYKNMLGLANVPDLKKMPREDVTVAAGTFKSCFKNDKPPKIAGINTQATSYFHFAVPISATVKVVGKDGATQMELLAYGLSGATSEF